MLLEIVSDHNLRVDVNTTMVYTHLRTGVFFFRGRAVEDDEEIRVRRHLGRE